MKQKLTKRQSITVDQLRADRELLPDLRGEISDELRGEITGFYGDATGITGNLDKCELTDEERKAGVDICDLVK